MSPVPQYAPTDVVVDQDSVTDTEADLTFSAIDESPEAIRGFFRGYRVSFRFLQGLQSKF